MSMPNLSLSGQAFANVLTSNDVDAALRNVDKGLLKPLASGDGKAVLADGTIRLATHDAGDIVLSLPVREKPKMDTDGSREYLGGKSAVVVRPTDGGAQSLLFMNEPSAPTDYTFRISNGFVGAALDGGLVLFDHNRQPARIIPAPWAYDAHKRPVQTRFTVNHGNTAFTQVVVHKDAQVAYPVVADPIVIWLMGVTVYCFVKGSYEARNLKGQPWYVWAWGMLLACSPF